MRSGMAVRLGAEAIGALILVYFGCGAIISGLGGLVGVALAFSVALGAAIWILGPTSGGHFNPWVTLAFALRGRFPWVDAAMYAGAQIVGGFVGALLLWATYGGTAVDGLLGATHVADNAQNGKGLVGALLAEAIATFLLVCVVFSLTATDRAVHMTSGLGIGLAVGVSVLAIGVLTGASMNFARTFGPELTLTFAGGSSDWGHIWVYLVGPAIGAVAAAYAFDAITEPSARPASMTRNRTP
jgi:MIP family channel proteins